jgi:hypothetical protein
MASDFVAVIRSFMDRVLQVDSDVPIGLDVGRKTQVGPGKAGLLFCRGNNMIRSAVLAAISVAFAPIVPAAELVVRFAPEARQVWCIAPTADKSVYRLCVVTLASDGAPARAILANAATYGEKRWSIREGREIHFAEADLEVKSMPKIAGVRAELSLDPGGRTTDPRVEQVGDAMIFSENSLPPEHGNASIFSLDDRTHVLTYIFARKAIVSSEKNRKTINLLAVVTVQGWPDSRVPVTSTAGQFSLP